MTQLKLYLILGAVAFYLISMGGAVIMAHKRGADDNEAAHIAQDLKATKQVLGDFVAAANSMNRIAGELTGINTTLSTTIGKISRDFRNVTHANPLPADCRPDAFRVQSLTAAIGAANSAAGRSSGPAVPPAP